MRNLEFRKPSPALVIASIALFVALGSGAYAANKVGTNQIKNKAVTKQKLAGKSVTKVKLADEAVTTRKLQFAAVGSNQLGFEAVTTSNVNEGAITESKLSNGAVGTAKISNGAVKSDELGEITNVEETSPPAALPGIDATADCPAGTKVISGGFEVTGVNPNDPPIPTGDKRSNNGWEVSARAQAAGDTVTAYAYCLESSS